MSARTQPPDATNSDLLAELRPVASAAAYRMLGTVSEAEDVAQEALLRFHRVLETGEPVKSPHAYLVTITTRLALNQLRTIRARREMYVGEWLPEPLVDYDDPAAHADRADSLSVAFLVLLESLTPEQRAAFLLREVFGYEYEQIAEVIGKTATNTRQLVARARKHVHDGRPRFAASREAVESLADRFFAAAENGDLDALVRMLAGDVILCGDGGGKAPSLAGALTGNDRVARTLRNWFKAAARLGATTRRCSVNGQPGLELRAGDGIISVMALQIAGDRIEAVNGVINPDKLAHLGPRSKLTALRQPEET